MNIEIFSICDAATAESGKLNMLGVFDTLWASKVPVVHPQCMVVLRLRLHTSEGNKHNISVKFIDADGKHIVPPTNGEVRIRHPKGQRSSAANVILNIQGLKLEKFGEYSIDLSIGGRSVASLPFFVRERKKEK